MKTLLILIVFIFSSLSIGATKIPTSMLVGSNLVQTSGTTKPKICSWVMAANGANGEVSGGCISSTTLDTQGNYSANFTAGYWAATPKCFVMINQDNTGQNYSVTGLANSTTQYKYETTSNAANANLNHYVICHGSGL